MNSHAFATFLSSSPEMYPAAFCCRVRCQSSCKATMASSSPALAWYVETVTNIFVASFSSVLPAFLHVYRDESLVAHSVLQVLVEVYPLQGVLPSEKPPISGGVCRKRERRHDLGGSSQNLVIRLI